MINHKDIYSLVTVSKQKKSIFTKEFTILYTVSRQVDASQCKVEKSYKCCRGGKSRLISRRAQLDEQKALTTRASDNAYDKSDSMTRACILTTEAKALHNTT